MGRLTRPKSIDASIDLSELAAMADGGVTLELNGALAKRLIAAAEDAGRPVTDFAAELIDGALDEDWSETERRWVEYEKTGDSVSAEEAMGQLRDGLKARFAARS